MTSLRSRVLVAIVGIPVLVWVVLWAHPVVMMSALALLAGIAAHELMSCLGVENDKYLRLSTGIAAMLSVVLYNFLPEYVAVWWVLHLLGTCVYAIVKAGEVKFLHISASVFSVIVIPYSFSAFLRIGSTGVHRAYLLLPFILSFACDTFAYFVGCSIGKHRLAPKVSPKKSVEGFLGGLIGNALCGLLFAFCMDRCFGANIGYGAMVVLALVCGTVAQIGDLSFSLIKREFGIKDYGHLFLGHGGVLDRFDSVLFVTPFIEIILRILK